MELRRYAPLFAYMLSVVAANVAISVFGIVPVGFGMVAPAGVYVVGLSFTLRDVVQDRLGRWATLAAILGGAVLSAAMSPQLAAASGAAFLASELADFAIYTPLRRRSWLLAIVLSNTVGAVVDSAIFLTLAFGSLAYLPGQVWGKTIMVLPVVAWRAVQTWRAAAPREA